MHSSWVNITAIYYVSPVLADAFTDFLQDTVLFIIKKVWLIFLNNLAACAYIYYQLLCYYTCNAIGTCYTRNMKGQCLETYYVHFC